MIKIIMALVALMLASRSFAEMPTNAVQGSNSIAYLIRCLDDHDPSHSKETLAISRQFQTPLVGWSPTPSDAARNALVKIGSTAVPSLVDVLSDTKQDHRTRLHAAQVLVQLRDERAQPAFVTGSTSTNFALAVICCQALLGTPDKDKATDRLLGLVADTNLSTDDLRQVVDQLVSAKESRAVPLMIAAMQKTSALRTEDSAKRMATYGWGLEHLTGQAFGSQPELWEKWLHETRK